MFECCKLHSDRQLHWNGHGFYKQRSYRPYFIKKGQPSRFYKMGDMILIVNAGFLL